MTRRSPSMLILLAQVLGMTLPAIASDGKLDVSVTEMEPVLFAKDRFAAAFWFPPASWTPTDLRLIDLRIPSFDPEGPVAARLAVTGQLSAARRQVVAAPGSVRSQGDARRSARVATLLRPQLRIRIAPRFPLSAGPGAPPKTHPIGLRNE